MPILPKIDKKPTREELIDLHQLISGNAASVVSYLRGGQQEHLALKIKAEEYMEQIRSAFVLPYNPCKYPQSMGNSQEQALGTEKFRKDQALFRKYTALDGASKKQIITTVEPVLLSPLVDQLTGFGQVSAITMLQHLFTSYGAIDKIDFEENAVKMMEPYNPAEHPSQILEQFE